MDGLIINAWAIKWCGYGIEDLDTERIFIKKEDAEKELKNLAHATSDMCPRITKIKLVIRC